MENFFARKKIKMLNQVLHIYGLIFYHCHFFIEILQKTEI